jgi:hypothetical protein
MFENEKNFKKYLSTGNFEVLVIKKYLKNC